MHPVSVFTILTSNQLLIFQCQFCLRLKMKSCASASACIYIYIFYMAVYCHYVFSLNECDRNLLDTTKQPHRAVHEQDNYGNKHVNSKNAFCTSINAIVAKYAKYYSSLRHHSLCTVIKTLNIPIFSLY